MKKKSPFYNHKVAGSMSIDSHRPRLVSFSLVVTEDMMCGPAVDVGIPRYLGYLHSFLSILLPPAGFSA